MTARPGYNMNSSGRRLPARQMCLIDRLSWHVSAVKRIMQEARELANDPCTDYSAAPLEVCPTRAISALKLTRLAG